MNLRLIALTTAAVLFGNSAGAAGAESDGGLRSAIVVRALTLIDTPYRYGGTTPQGGFDCSGLVRYVYDTVGAGQLPRRAEDIGKVGVPITRSQLEPGDLVFFNTLARAYSHVAIYIGDGRFIHAPVRGGRVRIEALNARYWNARFDGARRVLDRDAEAWLAPAEPALSELRASPPFTGEDWRDAVKP